MQKLKSNSLHITKVNNVINGQIPLAWTEGLIDSLFKKFHELGASVRTAKAPVENGHTAHAPTVFKDVVSIYDMVSNEHDVSEITDTAAGIIINCLISVFGKEDIYIFSVVFTNSRVNESTYLNIEVRLMLPKQYSPED